MRLIDRISGQTRSPERLSLDDYAKLVSQFTFDSWAYPTGLQQTLVAGQGTEAPPNNFEGLVQQAYKANGIVFACMLARMLVFSGIRFRWQRLRDGQPSDTFGNRELALLERPWKGGTTQDMLSRLLQDADLAGNSYWVRQGDELVRLRPDWVQIIGRERYMNTDRAGRNRGGGQVGWIKIGYAYTEGGPKSGNEPVAFTVDEVAHFAPIPDPEGVFIGMSWLTPILREIQNDRAMNRHQSKFFDNGATPNMIIKHAAQAAPEAIIKWASEMQAQHGGVDNAYKTLNLYPGADATVVGTNLKDIDFDNVRGGGEVRVAAAAGVPPVIAGLSKGLESSTYSNYSQARRRFADGTIHPLWQNASGSMENVLTLPDDASRLWYDASGVPFLREDEKDAAEIAEIRARTIRTYVDGGYEPKSVIAAVEADDLRLLQHTGWFSVQLQQPGATPAPTQTPAPPKKVASSRESLAIEGPADNNEEMP